MSSRIRRRAFLGRGTATVALASLPWSALLSRTARAGGPGPLVRDPARICDLPDGFSYSVLERTGDRMDDGWAVPGLPDGMACFAGAAGQLVLMRNHELDDLDRDLGPYGAGRSAPGEAYDAAALGGVTRVVVDAVTFRRVSSNLVLAGTSRNCAGGTSPWGWLSCEEIFDARHGYVFLCDPSADRVQPARRIPSYGHFKHEAATVDPASLVCFLTEDQTASCFYRFVPHRREEPFEGKLMAMKIAGEDRFDTGERMRPGQTLPVEWVVVDEPNPAKDTVRAQAQAKGAAIVRRGEGLWLNDGAVYFVSTNGGPRDKGQLFRHVPGEGERGGTLELVAHADEREGVDGPDNVAVAPWGGVFVAEDGSGENYVRGLTSDGRWFDFARNAKSKGELAGVCFSPDGNAMFVNWQRDGLTLAITGPFERVREGRPVAAPQPSVGDRGSASPSAVARSGCGACTSTQNDDATVAGGAAAAAVLAALALRRRAGD